MIIKRLFAVIKSLDHIQTCVCFILWHTFCGDTIVSFMQWSGQSSENQYAKDLGELSSKVIDACDNLYLF